MGVGGASDSSAGHNETGSIGESSLVSCSRYISLPAFSLKQRISAVGGTPHSHDSCVFAQLSSEITRTLTVTAGQTGNLHRSTGRFSATGTIFIRQIQTETGTGHGEPVCRKFVRTDGCGHRKPDKRGALRTPLRGARRRRSGQTHQGTSAAAVRVVGRCHSTVNPDASVVSIWPSLISGPDTSAGIGSEPEPPRAPRGHLEPVRRPQPHERA